MSVFRPVPKRLRRPRSETLPLEQLDPLIRVAHRRASGAHLTFPERVIVDHEFLLILSGHGDLAFRDHVVPFGPHDVLFVRPFVPHTFAGRGDVDHIAIHFDFSPRRLEADLERRHPYRVELAGDLTLPTKQRVAARGAVERALGLVVEHFARATAEGRLRARGEFLCALAMLLSQEPHRRGELGLRRARLERAVNLMQQRIADPIALGDLERATGLGSSQLHLLFRELTGYTPLEYLRRLRIERARELLSDASLSIKEVAVRAGFSDANHFSRVFSRLDGIPPTAFREALLSSVASADQ